jgi:hypothetical protein
LYPRPHTTVREAVNRQAGWFEEDRLRGVLLDDTGREEGEDQYQDYDYTQNSQRKEGGPSSFPNAAFAAAV